VTSCSRVSIPPLFKAGNMEDEERDQSWFNAALDYCEVRRFRLVCLAKSYRVRRKTGDLALENG
jgi:hypothetical protein